jgi:hypothetical protein
VAARDGAGWIGKFSGSTYRDSLTVRFPPAEPLARDRLMLVVRNIRSSEQVLQRYLGELGPGFPGLLRRLSGLPGYRNKLGNILEESGLALGVTASQPGRSPQIRHIAPVGSLGARVVALELPGLDPALPVEVKLDALPTAWEVDAVFLARAASDRVVVTESAPVRALKSDGGAAPALSEGTPYRQSQGEHLDLAFEVPPGRADGNRSYALAVRGHYELVPGQGRGVDWGLLGLRTLWGKDSFARYLRGNRLEPRWSLCPKRILRDMFSDRGDGADPGAKLACAGEVAR